MEIYKAPLSPTINESLIKIIQDGTFYENDDENRDKLLSSIDFNLIKKSNEEIDLISSKKMFSDLLTLLNSGKALTDFPDFLIPRILDLSSFYPSDNDLKTFTVNFIFFLSQLDDEICFNYVQEMIINFLIETIDSLLNLEDVRIALLCLTNFVMKEKTKNNLDGSIIFHKSIQLQNHFRQNYDFNDQLKYEKLIFTLFDLIASCIISYKLSEDEIESVIQLFIDFLNSNKENENETENKVNRIFQISSMQAISKTVFWKSKKKFLLELSKESEESEEESDESDFYVSHFINQEILNLLIGLIKSDFKFELEALSMHAFCILENLSFIDFEFSLSYIGHFSSLLFFKPPDEWKLNSKTYFCRSLVTSIGKTNKCRELNKGGKLLDNAMSNLRESAQFVVPLMMSYIENQGYKLRKVATMVLCQLITLYDPLILNVVMQGHKNIIEDFIFFLDDNVKPNFAYPLIKSMKVLSLYGDKISENSPQPNPFFGLILDLNIESVLDNCIENYADSKKIILSIEDFKVNIIEKLKDCHDIDKFNRKLEEEEEIFEILME